MSTALKLLLGLICGLSGIPSINFNGTDCYKILHRNGVAWINAFAVPPE